jgi:acyl-CoA synthetase (AMP-forming)/AMP-acid ligase II
LREGSSLAQEELLVHCRERLTGYKVPKYLEFRASLPKTDVGKVLRRALAEEQSSRAA